MKILDVMWFCAGHGNVGIVKILDEYDGIRYYLGQCKGLDIDEDINHIHHWGSVFPNEAGDVLFGGQ